MLSSVNWGLISLFSICLFPLMPTLSAQNIPIAIGLIIQLGLAIQNRKSLSSRGIWLPILLSVPVLLLLCSMLWTEDLRQGTKYMERQVMLLLFPWVLFYNRGLFSQKWQSQVLRFFALGMALLTVYLFAQMLLTGKFFSILQHSNSYFFIREFIEQKLGLHPTYYSILLAIALFATLYELLEEHTSSRSKWAAVLVLLSLILGLVLASSKMILFASLLGSALLLRYKWGVRLGLKRVVVPVFVAVLLFAAIPPLRNRTIELIKALSETGVNKDNPDSMRKVIYEGTLAAIKDNAWIGVGIGDAQQELNIRYAQLGFEEAVRVGYNTHNNYLHFWLTTGFFGFVLFTLIQGIHLLIALVNRNPVHLAVSLLFSLSMLTENILSRQVGIFTYAFFSSFLAFCSWSLNRNSIGINGRFLTQKLSGVQRYAREISKVLLAKHPDFVLLVPKGAERFDAKQRSIPVFSGTLWEQVSLPLYAKLMGCPTLLHLGNTAPICYRHNYLTLHDVAFLENEQWFSKNFVRWYRFMLPRVIKKASGIFTVSAFSKSEIAKHFAVSQDKITVTYNGLPEFAAAPNTDKPLLTDTYVLAVGTLSARKNQELIVKCFTELQNELPLKLVLAGDINETVLGELRELKQAIEAAPNIIWMRQPSDAELQNLYTHAFCTVYMPHYEGFGLPVLESLAYGKTTIVSDIAVFREIFHGLVLFSSPKDHRQLISVLKECMEHPNTQKPSTELAEQLKERFSYDRAAALVDSQLRTSYLK